MYYFLYSFLYLLSLLPLRVLYVISDAIYFLVYYVAGYRKAVVMQNLAIAFPDSSAGRRKKIAREFYRRFIDSLIESLKLLSANTHFFEKRFQGNWEVVDRFYDEGRAVQLHLGHTFNWEWGNAVLTKKIRYPFLGVYMPLKNRAIDRLFLKMRSRHGSILLSAQNMAREFAPYRGTKYCLGLVADQNPGYNLHLAKWFTFFNRRTPFTISPAKNAIRNDAVVIFAAIRRPRRGYYEVSFEVGEENPSSSNEDQLTLKFVRYLEQVIIRDPSMWLWSHRRWKHAWEDGLHFVA